MGKGRGGKAGLRKRIVLGQCPVKDKKVKDLPPAYCCHPEPSLM